MIELPEVFWVERMDPLDKNKRGGRAWIDAFVGNPPFAGKNTIAAMTLGAPLLDWLKQIHFGSHGNSDYVAHFFRRCDNLLGNHGTLGLLATNTIAQGDTRATGLKFLVANGATIYSATRSMVWPGEAAVTVAVVHVERGRCTSSSRILNGFSVPEINTRLRAGTERSDPIPLKANANMSFQGCIVLGLGFVLTPEERDSLVTKSKKNAERIFPYLGGEEVNSSPTQTFDRYVINFGDMTLDEASRWPELVQIVREKVKPERDKNNREVRRKYWWRFAESTPALRAALTRVEHCLVTARVTKHLCFSFQPADRVFNDKLYVFPLGRMRHFTVLQSRLHCAWTWLLSSTMKADLNYSASDCFDNFPFPVDATLGSLEAIGKLLYDARASYMMNTNHGLTVTYNQLKDPDCVPERTQDLAAILHLRQLHEDLDRAVLAAYGWSDITVPPFCPATDAERAAVSLFEDAVIDRLFALNAERAAAEAKAAGTTVQTTAKPKAAKKPKKVRGSKSQTSMLDDE